MRALRLLFGVLFGLLCLPRVGWSQPEVVGQWSGVFPVPLVAIHVAHLPTGKYLIFGRAPLGDIATLWDPKTNTFRTIGSLGVDIFCAGHTFLSDGTLLVNGGHIADDYGIRDTLIFNPYTETWKRVGNMAYPRWYPTTTILSSGKVITHSGSMWRDANGPVMCEIPELYDPETQQWTTLPNLRNYAAYYPGMYQLPDGRLVIAGKGRTNWVETDSELLNWWESHGTFSWVGMGGSSTSYRPGMIMKSGGTKNADADEARKVSVLDLTQPDATWRETAPMAEPRKDHCTVPLPDGNVLITGGSRIYANLAESVLSPELWDPISETLSIMAPQAIGRSYHSTGILMADGRVLSAGGGSNGRNVQPNPDQLNGEIFSPPYLFKGARPVISSIPEVTINSQSFTVVTPQASSIAKVSLIRLGAVTHGLDMSAYYIPLSFTRESGKLNVVAPTKFEAPPGYYMLSVVNGAGVPSVSKYLLVTQQLPTTKPDTVLSTYGGSPDSSPALLEFSDDQWLRIDIINSSSPYLAVADLVVEAPAPSKHISFIKYSIEASLEARGYSVKLDLYDFENDVWENVGATVNKRGERTASVTVKGYVSRFVDRTAQKVRARARFFSPDLTVAGQAKVDMMSFGFGK
ncbi:MAG: galactose oxidase-like domain-containing protein [Fimbriimonadaceae bacterium]